MPVSNKLFLSHVNIDDPLTRVVRCHQDFDALLTEIINKVLIESHYLEVERIPFPLKVELAIALGKVEMEARSPLLKFNSIRNEFTHDSKTSLTEEDARDFYNVFDSPKIRAAVGQNYDSIGAGKPASHADCVVALLCGVLYSGLQIAVERILWEKAEDESLREWMNKEPPVPQHIREQTHKELLERVERMKKERSEDK